MLGLEEAGKVRPSAAAGPGAKAEAEAEAEVGTLPAARRPATL